jgi:hypothetical protein
MYILIVGVILDRQSYVCAFMEVINVFMASFLGFVTFHLTHSEKGRIGKKLPEIKVSRIQFSPSIKLELMGRTIWFHHWFNFTILIIISLFVTNAFLDSAIIRSFLAGGILQGLSLPDAHRFVHRNQ